MAKKTKKASKPAKAMKGRPAKAAPQKSASRPAMKGKAMAKPAKVDPIPPGFHTVTPHIICRKPADAIEFYKKAFGAKEISRMNGPDGNSIIHAEIRIGESIVMIAEEMLEMQCKAPQTLGGSPVSMHVYVKNVDKAFEQAVAAGATVEMPLMDMFWGDRYGKLKDPFGHEWTMASRQKILNKKQMMKAMMDFCAQMPQDGQSAPASAEQKDM